jgi:hypothetical protein
LKKRRYADGPPRAEAEAGEARASLKHTQRLSDAAAAPRDDDDEEAEAE